MSTFGSGARRTIEAGTALSPSTAALDLKPYVTDVSGDQQIDQEEQTTLAATDHTGAKSFLYGNNGETGEIQVQYDKEGVLIHWLEDIKAAGVQNSDFNVVVFDYPFGKKTGAVYFMRPVKISGYRIQGGIAAKVAGSVSFQRSGEVTVGTVA